MQTWQPALQRRGFTLVEIMIVVVIIGLLAAIAIPALQRVQRRAQVTRFISDLRIFSQAFDTYAMENGTWPPNAGSGVVPTEVAEQISNEAWTAGNTLGGRWNWDFNRFGIVASISTTGVTASLATLTEARVVIEDLRIDHNTRRPHSRLGYRSPVNYATQLTTVPPPVGLRPPCVGTASTTTDRSTHNNIPD